MYARIYLWLEKVPLELRVYLRDGGGGGGGEGRSDLRGHSVVVVFFFAKGKRNDAGFRTGGRSSVHKLPYVSILFCTLRTTHRLCTKELI